MKKVYIDAPTVAGGVFYEVSHLPQLVPDDLAEHLVSIGNARFFESKVLPVEEKKSEPVTPSSVLPAAAVSQKPTVTRRGRPPKSGAGK